MMNGTTLRALRTLLFFNQPEAAELIGNVTERSWKYWESGGRTIPSDVISKINSLLSWRTAALEHTIKLLKENYPNNHFVFYENMNDWISLAEHLPLYYKPTCSVLAELCAYHRAVLIRFDVDNYFDWLGSRVDNESMRHKWGMLQQDSGHSITMLKEG